MEQRTKIIIGVAAAAAVTLIVVLVIALTGRPKTNGPKTESPPPPKPETINLTMWGLFDDREVFRPLIEDYEAENPKIKITYKKMDPATYEKDVTDAIASENAPDIWLIHNDWLPKHLKKLEPMPQPYMSLQTLADTFAPVVMDDLVSGGRIYGLPLFMETLALFYNTDIFYNAKISNPPQTWDEFITIVKELVRREGNDQIVMAGAALGTANNIPRAVDILYTLMLQNMQERIGMTSDDHINATFNQYVDIAGQPYYPGTVALDFYTSYARPNKETYTWNSTLPDATTAFSQGKAAMMFGYSYMIPTILRLAPNLKFDIVPVPQIKGAEKQVTLANYWAWTVSKQSKNKDEAWKFLLYLTSKEVASMYKGFTNRPPARLDVAGVGGRYYSAFTNQLKIARSWYKGEANQVDKIFSDTITNVVQYNQTPQSALDAAARLVGEILKIYQ